MGGQRERRRPRRRALCRRRFASSSERRVYSASRRLHPSPSLSIAGRARHRDARGGNTRQLLLDMLRYARRRSARARKRCASFPEAKETKKNETRRLGAVSVVARLRRASVVVPSRVGSPVPACLPAGPASPARHYGQVPVISPRSAPDRARRGRRRRAPPDVAATRFAALAWRIRSASRTCLTGSKTLLMTLGEEGDPRARARRPRRPVPPSLIRMREQLLTHALHLGQAVPRAA